MKENRTNSIFYDGLLKAAGVLILCVCGAGLMVSAAAWVLSAQYGLKPGIPYTECEGFNRKLEQDAHRIEHMYDSGAIANAEIVYGPSVSNVQYALETYDPETGLFEKVSANNHIKVGYALQKEFVFGVLQQGHEEYSQYYFKGDLSIMPKEAYNGYRVTMFVQNGLPIGDDYQQDCRIYEWLENTYKSETNAMAACVLCAAVMIAVLVFEWNAAGHVKGKEGITLLLWDHIPMDLFTVFLLMGEGFLLIVLDEVSDLKFMENPSLADSLAPFILIVLAGALLFYVWLMSLARRIKAGTIWKNNLWRFVFDALVYAIREVPLFLKLLVLFLTGWLFFAGIVLPVHFLNSRLYLISVLFTILFILVIFHGMYCHHETGKAAQEIAAGNSAYRISEAKMKRMAGSFRKEAKALNSIGEGMKIAIDEQLKSERMKTELITNVSHDLRTPLTSIISYTDLLQKEHTPEQEKEYLDILMKQSLRLKKLSEDIMEASKASSGALTAEIGKVSVQEMIDQALAEYQEKFALKHLDAIVNIQENLAVKADGKLLWRVLNNLFSNIDKYALENTRVYIDAKKESDGMVRISVKNISKDPLNIQAEELMERFVRGDESRHTEGSGLGLSIAMSLSELMNGNFSVSIDGDLFRADIRLEEYKD